jgi:hypothetical protein
MSQIGKSLRGEFGAKQDSKVLEIQVVGISILYHGNATTTTKNRFLYRQQGTLTCE